MGKSETSGSNNSRRNFLKITGVISLGFAGLKSGATSGQSISSIRLPPFLAAAGEFDEALKQIEGYKKYLYHEKEQLYSHIWDGPNRKFIREDFWGVGNGWTADCCRIY
jgi:hypothetical protein